MKNFLYKVNINQAAAIINGLKGKVDFNDLAIFDVMLQFSKSRYSDKKKDRHGYWFSINWRKIQDQLPLLDIKSRNGINKRIYKVIRCGLIDAHPDNGSGGIGWYKLGPLSDDMIYLNPEKLNNLLDNDQYPDHERVQDQTINGPNPDNKSNPKILKPDNLSVHNNISTNNNINIIDKEQPLLFVNEEEIKEDNLKSKQKVEDFFNKKQKKPKIDPSGAAKKIKVPMQALFESFTTKHKELFTSKGGFYAGFSWGTKNSKQIKMRHLKNLGMMIIEDIAAFEKIPKEDVSAQSVADTLSFLMQTAYDTQKEFYISKIHPLGLFQNYNPLKNIMASKSSDSMSEEDFEQLFE